MTNEEMKAKYDSINSMEECYAMMVENGYTGSRYDFAALAIRAAEEMPMDMDDMEQVAGGVDFQGAVDTVVDAMGKTWNWIKENPGTTAEIIGGAAVTVVGITYAVKSYRRAEEAKGTFTPEKYVELEAEATGALLMNKDLGGIYGTADPAVDKYDMYRNGYWMEYALPPKK